MIIEYYIVKENGRDIGEGPWDKRRTYDRSGAQEFLDCEVGVPARVVAIRKREEETIFPADIENAIATVARNMGKTRESVIQAGMIDYLSRLGFLGKRNILHPRKALKSS